MDPAPATTWVFIHGFCHTGTTIFHHQLARYTGWRVAAVFEGQWVQRVFPAWHLCGNQSFDSVTRFPEWVATRAQPEKQAAALERLLSPQSHSELLRSWTTMNEHETNEWNRQHANGSMRNMVYIEKDPRFDTIVFLPNLFNHDKSNCDNVVVLYGQYLCHSICYHVVGKIS